VSTRDAAIPTHTTRGAPRRLLAPRPARLTLVADATSADGSAPQSRTVFTRDGVLRGFVAAQPLAIGILVYGLTFGLLAFGSGLSIADSVLMSATVYSGSAQTAAVGALATGAGLVATVSTVLLLNARYLLYGATLRPWLGRTSPLHAYTTLYFLGDGNWLLSMKAHEQGERDAGYVFGSGAAMFVPWVGGTAAGAAIGKWIPQPSALGLDFLLVAFCAAMMIGMGRAKASPWPAIGALAAALLADRFAPAGWPIVAAGLAGAAIAWLVYRDHGDAAA
jgi:4-azaleucine resistance transporter AzlC